MHIKEKKQNRTKKKQTADYTYYSPLSFSLLKKKKVLLLPPYIEIGILHS